MNDAWTCERQDDDYGEIYWAIHDARTYSFIANVYSNQDDAHVIASALTSKIEITRLRDINADLRRALYIAEPFLESDMVRVGGVCGSHTRKHVAEVVRTVLDKTKGEKP